VAIIRQSKAPRAAYEKSVSTAVQKTRDALTAFRNKQQRLDALSIHFPVFGSAVR